jgi:hypothetical protein
MRGVDDLVTWLRAQLDDDERVARVVMAEPGGFYIEAETDDTNVMTIGAHVYRWTPKRVLAEVDAKRRMVDEAIRLESYGSEFQFLKMLALPYADRPGYRDEWRP